MSAVAWSSGVGLAAAGAAGLAALLVVPARPRISGSGGRSDRAGVVVGSAALVVVVVTASMVRPTAAPLLVIGGLFAGGVLVLVRRRARRRAAVEVAGRVLETCELLAAELTSGQPPGRALHRAASAWPVLAPAAESVDLGGDVPGVLRELARARGGRDLRLLAAAWVVAHRTGHGLADAVSSCADSIRGAEATRRVVAGELASARATARLVAGLPVLALMMGSGTGGDPLGFLLGSTPGLACLAGGLAFALAGLWWIEAIADDVDAAA